MERKIGEIFEYNGEWYQCVEGYNCKDCDLRNIICRRDTSIFPFKACSGNFRTDKKSVIFKKLKKVGGILGINEKTYQCIKPIDYKGCTGCAFNRSCNHICSGQGIYVEIRQNKEDMEEKKLNLKPFSLEAAKQGHPVCRRNGRKARIICFDANVEKGKPIVALLYDGKDREFVRHYTEEGKDYESCSFNDLMMLSEKKEGWVNVYKKSIYKTKEDAFNRRDK